MSTDTTNWVGRVLAGKRYRVMAMLGSGGMGFVYLARDRNLECDVVIKVPRPGMLDSQEFAGRFAREVRSLVRLAHPHIVKVIDVGEYEGHPYAVLQYLAGGSLRDQQPKKADGERLPLELKDVRRWLEDVASALDFMHGQHYIHRDVKPENILFDKHGHVYLSDFGVAKVLAENVERKDRTLQTGEGIFLGTPAYMAPELVLAQAYDGRIDQYALAITLYELLCGIQPFDGPTAPAFFVQHTSVPPRPMHEAAPSVPPGVAAAIHKAMAKDPSQRYPDCVSFARAVLQANTQPAHATERAPVASTQARFALVVACPECGKQFAVAGNAAGKRVRCPACRQVFETPPQPNIPATARVEEAALVTAAQVRERSAPERSAGREPASPTAAARAAPAPPARKAPAAQPAKPVPRASQNRRASNSRFSAGPLWAWFAAGGALIVLLLLVAICTRPRGTSNAAKLAAARDADAGASPVLDSEATTNAGKSVVARIPAKVGQLQEFAGHEGTVWCVAFSPDGRRALSGGTDQTLRLWDLESGTQLQRIKGHGASVTSVAFCPDGRRAVSGSADTMIRLWDLDNAQQLRTFPAHDYGVESVAVSPDGKHLLSASKDKTVRYWDLETGQVVNWFWLRGLPGWSVAFSRDGRYALWGTGSLTEQADQQTLWRWDLSSPQPVPFEDYRGSIRCVCFSSDGHRMLSGSADCTVREWDVERRDQIHRVGTHDKGVYGVAYAGENRAVSASVDGTIRLWNLKTGAEVHRFEGHSGAVWGLAVSPDGRRALSAGQDSTVRLWGLPE